MGPNPSREKFERMNGALLDAKASLYVIKNRLRQDDPFDRATIEEVLRTLQKIDQVLNPDEN